MPGPGWGCTPRARYSRSSDSSHRLRQPAADVTARARRAGPPAGCTAARSPGCLAHASLAPPAHRSITTTEMLTSAARPSATPLSRTRLPLTDLTGTAEVARWRGCFATSVDGEADGGGDGGCCLATSHADLGRHAAARGHEHVADDRLAAEFDGVGLGRLIRRADRPDRDHGAGPGIPSGGGFEAPPRR